jgi:hypothetical protein
MMLSYENSGASLIARRYHAMKMPHSPGRGPVGVTFSGWRICKGVFPRAVGQSVIPGWHHSGAFISCGFVRARQWSIRR